MNEHTQGLPSLMGARVEGMTADASQAYVTARELIVQIIGVLSARAASAGGEHSARLREATQHYGHELQVLGINDAVSVERVLTDYPELLRRLRAGGEIA